MIWTKKIKKIATQKLKHEKERKKSTHEHNNTSTNNNKSDEPQLNRKSGKTIE